MVFGRVRLGIFAAGFRGREGLGADGFEGCGVAMGAGLTAGVRRVRSKQKNGLLNGSMVRRSRRGDLLALGMVWVLYKRGIRSVRPLPRGIG
jgi:hypothetical protein